MDHPHEGLDGSLDRSTSFQEPITPGAATLLPSVFTPISVLDYRLSQATGERLAQVPHRLGYLRKGRLGLWELLLQSIEPLVKAVMELVAERVPLFSCTHLLER